MGLGGGGEGAASFFVQDLNLHLVGSDNECLLCSEKELSYIDVSAY